MTGRLGSADRRRIEPPDAAGAYGMCGRLATYPAARAAQIG